jgi:hypothetical protein
MKLLVCSVVVGSVLGCLSAQAQPCGQQWGGSGWGFSISFPVQRQPSYGYGYGRAYDRGFNDGVIWQAQRQLRRFGYYRGPIDGDCGPYTTRAIVFFQRDYGLPVSGRLCGRTLRRMGIY